MHDADPLIIPASRHLSDDAILARARVLSTQDVSLLVTLHDLPGLVGVVERIAISTGRVPGEARDLARAALAFIDWAQRQDTP